jgi:hypothetical protein
MDPYYLVLVTHIPGDLDLYVKSEDGASIKHSFVTGEMREDGQFAYLIENIVGIKENRMITVEAFQNDIFILKVDLIRTVKLSRLNIIEHYISGF